jgi:hypothetical protein
VRVRGGEREILARFEVLLAEIADEIADATVAEVAAFDPMRDAPLRAEIRALSRQQLDAFLDVTRLFDKLTAGGGAADLIPQATRQALGDPTLRDTVQAYIDADLSVTTAARAMSLHPDSVRYRLRRVAELTGRDPLKLTDLLELITAARLLGPAD